jgi:C4-dicarboxylate-specific signal transduction histidine kinase
LLGYLAIIGGALWIAFGIGAAADFKYFYVLFLPIIWAASRQGLAGAVLSAAIVQIGIISSVQLLGYSAVTVLEIQTLAAALALFGFFIGVVVDEKQRVSAELRQTLRLAAAGEMAGALAHELNQPLTALSAYGTACEQLLAQGETGERLRETIRRMVSESFRAAEVVRRLRDFFRTGATRLELVKLGDLLQSATATFAVKAQQHGIELIVEPVPACVLLVDPLQLEVVLRNLLGNAFEAVVEQSEGKRQIRISTHAEGAGRIGVRIEDSGPGLSGAKAAHLFEAFQSSKASGLGLGLVISRAIVEAHGGHLWAEVAEHGIFRLVLPTEGKMSHAV